MSQNVSESNKMRKEKQQQQRRHVFRAIFLLLGCHGYGYDATKVVLIKFGFSWTNICFDFIREEASKVDDDKNLCFLLCFKALTDIIN